MASSEGPRSQGRGAGERGIHDQAQYLGCELSSTVKPTQLAPPGGPELEAVTHHTVDGQPPFQVTQALGHMVGPRTLHHAG